MTTAYQHLRTHFLKIAHLDHAMTFLNWDQMVMMPAHGIERRSQSIAELTGIRHELLNDDAMADWFAEARHSETEFADSASLREMHRQWQQATCVPADLLKAQIVAGSKCEHDWRTQREANDWQGFLKNFKEVVSLSREEAVCRQAADRERFATPYDALLDLHCAGDTQVLINKVFGELKSRLPALLQEIMETRKSREPISIVGDYALDAQKALSEQLMGILGFDFDAGRLDVSMHPFSTGVKGDLRITTRFSNTEFAEALLGTAHETGHSSYESGLPDAWNGLPVGEACNMSIHESQSLMFEKQIVMSRAFCQFFTPLLHKALPDTQRFDADVLWQAYTEVKPSYIRVEADEVTYPLHIMLRHDIESALINGEVEAAEIPDLWDEKMQAYLGLSTKDNYTNGCLQDIHWTDGAFGYFPSYTLGAVNGAQMFAAIKQQHPDWQTHFEAGDVGFVREWLRERVWEQGSLLDSQELMRSATGETSNAEYLLAHLEARYLRGEY